MTYLHITMKKAVFSLALFFTLGLNSAAADAIRIVPLGDSITQGVGNDFPDPVGYDTYRRRLYQMLTAAGYDIDFVGSMNTTWKCNGHANDDFDPDHEGHFAWRTDYILKGRIWKCRGDGNLRRWLKNYTPDMALVHLGTNDMFEKRSVDSTLDDLVKVIDTLRKSNPDVVVFLARVLPTADVEKNQRIIALNARMDEVKKRSDQPRSRVIIVDQYDGFDVDKDFFDGVHPNLAGEEKMAQRWFDAIDAYLKTVSRSD